MAIVLASKIGGRGPGGGSGGSSDSGETEVAAGMIFIKALRTEELTDRQKDHVLEMRRCI